MPADHLLRSIDRFVDLSEVRRELRAVLQLDRASFGRSGADDPDADRRLLLRHPLGAPAVRGGASESGLSLVLPARAGGRRSRTTRPSPRTGMAASARATCCASVRDGVRRCMEEGLVGGEGFAVDASLIKADANKQRSAEGSEDGRLGRRSAATRAASVREYLDTLDDAACGAASAVEAEVHLAGRSGGAMDRRPEGPRLLRLRHQLPDRSRPRGHRRRRGDAAPSARPRSARRAP